MDIFTVCLVAFLLGFGINHFLKDATLATVVAVIAIVGGIVGIVRLVD